MISRRPPQLRAHSAPTAETNHASKPDAEKPKQKRRAPSTPPQTSRRANWNADWKLVWEGQHKSHQISLRLIAIVAFAALAVLIVISPLRSFMQQQDQIRSLNSQLAASEKHIEELEDEIDLWNDPQFIQSQARERLGYVMPGQTLYLVSGGEADPQHLAQKKIKEANDQRRAVTPFYITLRDSISVAGQIGDYENPQNVPVLNDKDNDPNRNNSPQK